MIASIDATSAESALGMFGVCGSMVDLKRFLFQLSTPNAFEVNSDFAAFYHFDLVFIGNRI
ncbi:MAG TPA: hypothetical protein VFD18_01950 [Chthoniobacterales bacterium]|jgi:hypothetical protein|nr:hypothetical protein [Chthoniobacterales bacterium]